MYEWLKQWWAPLSEGWKIAVFSLATTTSLSLLSEVFGARKKMICWLHIRTLERLENARKETLQEHQAKTATIFSWPNDPPIPIENLAERANIALWRARWATRWHERSKKYGKI
jgi:hypothetical protein